MPFYKLLQDQATLLGFAQVGISDIDLSTASIVYQNWIKQGFHGDMHYMENHGEKRWKPEQLVENTHSVLTLKMNYHTVLAADSNHILADSQKAFISRYALGRDYHKLFRQRLNTLALWLETYLNTLSTSSVISDALNLSPLQSSQSKSTNALSKKHSALIYRAFCDSAPVLERALAEKGGLGFTGKNTLIIDPDAGSYFFLGEIYLNITLEKWHELLKRPPQIPLATPIQNHCGRCTKCIDVCPTQAIIAPYQLDARRCISYLTIEHFGEIPLELRPLIGNRIYGCDDCQLVCPWNRFAKHTDITDFYPRSGLDHAMLLDLFKWDETQFLKKTEGSAIRRIGHIRWLRNIAVALGNGENLPEVIHALQEKSQHSHELVKIHCLWALENLTQIHPA